MNVRQILHGGRGRPNSGGASTGPAGRVTPSKQFAAPVESARAKNTQSDAALRPAGAEDSSNRRTLSKMPRIVDVPPAADVGPIRQNGVRQQIQTAERRPTVPATVTTESFRASDGRKLTTYSASRTRLVSDSVENESAGVLRDLTGTSVERQLRPAAGTDEQYQGPDDPIHPRLRPLFTLPPFGFGGCSAHRGGATLSFLLFPVCSFGGG
jgi:hypothetical protein